MCQRDTKMRYILTQASEAWYRFEDVMRAYAYTAAAATPTVAAAAAITPCAD